MTSNKMCSCVVKVTLLMITSLVVASPVKCVQIQTAATSQGAAIVFSTAYPGSLSETVFDPIIFNQVVVNQGLGYNHRTGIFTAPVAGIYQFVFAVQLCRQNFNNWWHFMVNHVSKSACHAQVRGGDTTLNTCYFVDALKQGDKVWIRQKAGSCGWAEAESKTITFSGVLLATEGVCVPGTAVVFSTAYPGSLRGTVFDPIIFNQMGVNQGLGYNHHTGIFTAPVAGIYQFVFAVQLWRENCNNWWHFMVNKVSKSACHAQVSDGDTTLNTCYFVDALEQGDKVWIRQNAGSCGWAEAETKTITFSGVLLATKGVCVPRTAVVFSTTYPGLLRETVFDPIIFNQMGVNQGLGYNYRTGIFTAPVAGIYQFVFAVQLCRENFNNWWHFMVNKVSKSACHAQVRGGDTTLNTCYFVDALKQGDKVWIRQNAGSCGWADAESKTITFSGVLLATEGMSAIGTNYNSCPEPRLEKNL